VTYFTTIIVVRQRERKRKRNNSNVLLSLSFSRIHSFFQNIVLLYSFAERTTTNNNLLESYIFQRRTSAGKWRTVTRKLQWLTNSTCEEWMHYVQKSRKNTLNRCIKRLQITYRADRLSRKYWSILPCSEYTSRSFRMGDVIVCGKKYWASLWLIPLTLFLLPPYIAAIPMHLYFTPFFSLCSCHAYINFFLPNKIDRIV